LTFLVGDKLLWDSILTLFEPVLTDSSGILTHKGLP
jgi:hypothetical protein